MSKEHLRFLLIDSHPLMLEGYKNVLSKSKVFLFKDPDVDIALNCDEACAILQSSRFPYDMVFLEIFLPPSLNRGILSGEDLGLKIKAMFPKTKLLVITRLTDKFRIRNIITNLTPEGFLLKGETTPSSLEISLGEILRGSASYSPYVIKILRSNMSNTYQLDEVDRRILYHLSKGTKTNQLPKYINLSLRAIENRKRRLKDIFGVTTNNVRDILEKAKENGYL